MNRYHSIYTANSNTSEQLLCFFPYFLFAPVQAARRIQGTYTDPCDVVLLELGLDHCLYFVIDGSGKFGFVRHNVFDLL
jgi:hypothetical protein